jgi:hypothetical protein
LWADTLGVNFAGGNGATVRSSSRAIFCGFGAPARNQERHVGSPIIDERDRPTGPRRMGLWMGKPAITAKTLEKLWDLRFIAIR